MRCQPLSTGKQGENAGSFLMALWSPSNTVAIGSLQRRSKLAKNHAGTSLALAAGVRAVLYSLLVVTIAGCTPAQRATAGLTVGGVGVVATALALESMVSSCHAHRDPHNVCVQYSQATPRSVGFPVAFGGLGAVVLGGIILSTAGTRHRTPSTDAPALPVPPEEPPELDQTEAVGMAVAYLLLEGTDRKSTPPELRGVDGKQSRLVVDGRHAELRNLRVRTATGDTWQTLGACYEYTQEWRVTSLGASPGCNGARGSAPPVGCAGVSCP